MPERGNCMDCCRNNLPMLISFIDTVNAGDVKKQAQTTERPGQTRLEDIGYGG